MWSGVAEWSRDREWTAIFYSCVCIIACCEIRVATYSIATGVSGAFQIHPRLTLNA